MVDGVVADEQRGVEGLRQQRVDGDHHQQHGQLQHRVQPQEDGARHHGQDAGEDKILPDTETDGQTDQTLAKWSKFGATRCKEGLLDCDFHKSQNITTTNNSRAVGLNVRVVIAQDGTVGGTFQPSPRRRGEKTERELELQQVPLGRSRCRGRGPTR